MLPVGLCGALYVSCTAHYFQQPTVRSVCVLFISSVHDPFLLEFLVCIISFSPLSSSDFGHFLFVLPWTRGSVFLGLLCMSFPVPAKWHSSVCVNYGTASAFSISAPVLKWSQFPPRSTSIDWSQQETVALCNPELIT